MHLTRIELQGFKSFAEKTIIELPSKRGNAKYPLTVIVGPNGSGKSNIADSIRWVLGEHCMKAIRGDKSEDVIFFGSQKRSRSSMAEVSLLFNNEDGAMVVDRPEIKITRRFYRDSTSEYLLNNAVCRLFDIHLLLAKANFGKESYTVIAQGMIDHLILMGGMERKIFFDEATGVRHLQIKKEQALKKLFTTYENLKQAKLLLEEIEPRMRSLTRQVRRLEEKEKIEQELFDLQKKYFSTLWHDLMQEKKKWQDKLAGLKTQLAVQIQEIEKIEKTLSAVEKEETESDTLLQLQKQYQSLLEKKQALKEKEFAWRQAQIANYETTKRYENYKIDLASLSFELEMIYKEYENLIAGLEKVADVSSLKTDLQKNTERLRDLLSKLKGEAPTKENTDEFLSKAKTDLDVISQEILRIQQELSEFSQKEKSKKAAFFEAQRGLIQEQENRHGLENQINEIKIEMAKLEVRQTNLQNELLTDLKEKAEEVKNIAPEMVLSEAEALLPQIQKLKRQIGWIGGIDPETIKEYNETKKRTTFLQIQCKDLEESIQSLVRLANDLEFNIQKQFDEGFNKINQKFDEYFKILFAGGQAKLIKVVAETKEEDELEEQAERSGKETSILDQLISRTNYLAIEIQATPPGKKLKNIRMLSGGEKALTSIALLSAVLSVNPPPFILLDEVDAALDENNSLRFAKILDQLSNHTQLIAITHNRATMEAAGLLYGVTIDASGISKMLSVKLEEGIEMTK